MSAAHTAAVAERLAALRERIRGAGGEDVLVVAVTKGFDADAVRAALQAGLSEVGENYAQELLGKYEELAGSGHLRPRWHFLGRLQRNKVRRLAGLVSLWQSVDRPELVDEIARRAPGAAVLVQVNVTAEPQKGGCPPDEVDALVARARAAELDLRGLMAVGPTGPPEAAREPFRRLVRLADEHELPVRSIGMTEDLEVAVEEGATMVRVGRGLLGERTS